MFSPCTEDCQQKNIQAYSCDNLHCKAILKERRDDKSVESALPSHCVCNMIQYNKVKCIYIDSSLLLLRALVLTQFELFPLYVDLDQLFLCVSVSGINTLAHFEVRSRLNTFERIARSLPKFLIIRFEIMYFVMLSNPFCKCIYKHES